MAVPDTQDSEMPERVVGAKPHVRAWRKVATLLRALADPQLTYHSMRLRRNQGVSQARHIFVCGVPRAGTSLIATIMECNSMVASMGQENAFFMRRNFSNLALPELDAQELRHLGMAAGSQADLFDAIAATILGRAAGTSRYLDKSPGNVLEIGRISQMFPEARTILLARDPRDGFVSFNRHPGLKAKTPQTYALLWNRFTDAILAASAEPGKMLLTYEDLCRAPEAKVREMCAFTDIEFEADMLDPKAHALAKGAYGSGSGHERIGKPISASSIGGWREKLDEQEAAQIAQLCAANMAALGYDSQS